jgi:phage terminase small subunit
MATLTRDEVLQVLAKNGVKPDRAALYADCYLEYQQATANIAEYGLIVKHPRTGNPVTNPFLAIRDGAQKKLAKMLNVKADGLW